MRLSFALDEFKTVYLCVTVLAWLVMALFAPRYLSRGEHKRRFLIFSILTFIGTAGVFVSGDLLTLFMFFELMSMASYVWVAQEESDSALRAADTYMAVAVIGGLVLLMGLFLLNRAAGTLNLSELKNACAQAQNRKLLCAAAGCMLFGFGAKAGAFPLHIWLPKAHPIAPAPASALLSGILTKTGVYGIIVVCMCVMKTAAFGWIVMTVAVITMVTGAVLAVFGIDLKRILACSSVSQIGFILTGVAAVAICNEAVSAGMTGALIHMINHSVLKLVLFFGAGVVYQNAHTLDLNGLRGFGRQKPFLMVMFLVGALGIGGVPGLNGYVSKTILHEALDMCAENAKVPATICIVLFVITGGLTMAYMAKIFVCLFVQKNADGEVQNKYDLMKAYISPAQRVAMLIPALVIPAIGFLPTIFAGNIASYGVKPFADGESVTHLFSEVFSASGFLAAAESMAIGALVYFFILRDVKACGYCNRWPEWLDIEEKIYRPLLLNVLPAVLGAVSGVFDKLVDAVSWLLNNTLFKKSSDVAVAKKKLTAEQKERILQRGIITRSLSYGLMMACLGMFFLLGYLLYLLFAM